MASDSRAGAVLRTLGAAAVSGTVAGATSTIALAVMARAEGKGALQPTNATSHWLNGEEAASVQTADLRHTVVGYATNHAAAVFWAALFEAWIARRRTASAPKLLGHALLVSAIAVAVDYGATPRRFTPGWEFVLSKRSMAIAYVAMAVGLAASASSLRQARP